MTDPKKKAPKEEIKEVFVVAVDQLTIGGVCNGLKNGTVISESVETQLKKRTVDVVAKDKKVTKVPMFDVFAKNKTIQEQGAFKEAQKPAEDSTESAK